MNNNHGSFRQIYAIIPAAGKGSRYGESKVDATYREKTFLKYILDTLSQTPVAGVKVVRDVETIDMLASIRMGLELAKNDGWSALGWLIWPVDHPLIKVHTIRSLIEHFYRKPTVVINPLYEGQRGHPVIIPDSLQIPDNYISGGLRSIIANSTLERNEIEVSDPHIIKNINSHKDLLINV